MSGHVPDLTGMVLGRLAVHEDLVGGRTDHARAQGGGGASFVAAHAGQALHRQQGRQLGPERTGPTNRPVLAQQLPQQPGLQAQFQSPIGGRDQPALHQTVASPGQGACDFVQQTRRMSPIGRGVVGLGCVAAHPAHADAAHRGLGNRQIGKAGIGIAQGDEIAFADGDVIIIEGFGSGRFQAALLAFLALFGCTGAIVARDHLLDRIEDFLDRRFTCLAHAQPLFSSRAGTESLRGYRAVLRL